jgi:hypothetical protein
MPSSSRGRADASLAAARRNGRGVVLGYEPLTGHAAHEPWQDAELDAAVSALRVSTGLLTPAPAVQVPTVADRMAGRCETWRGLVSSGRYGPVEPSRLGRWERDHLDRLADLESRWQYAVEGSTLLHFDLRHDNCIVDADGTMTFVDWGVPARGPPGSTSSASCSSQTSGTESGVDPVRRTSEMRGCAPGGCPSW